MESSLSCHLHDDGAIRLGGMTEQMIRIGLALTSTRKLEELLELVLLEHLEEVDRIRQAYLDSDADFEKFRNYSLLKINSVL